MNQQPLPNNASKLQGIIKTEIKVNAKTISSDDGEHTFTFRFDEKTYRLVLTMLETGAPVWFGMQKDFKDTGGE